MSSFFTIPYIAFLGFILLLILGIYIFLVKRMANQNHQFSSIVGVVTSLADELTRLKEFISTTLIHNTNDKKEVEMTKKDLIHVSDDSDEEETDDESDDDSDDDSDDSDLFNEIASNLEIETHDDIKYIQITPSIKDDDLIKVSEKDLIKIDQLLNEETVNEETLNEDKKSLNEVTLNEETMNKDSKSLNEVTLNEDKVSLIDTNFNEVTLNEVTLNEVTVNEEDDDSSINYKKLPLNKLRSLIVEKGLAEDASKLKKIALLQLLEQI